MKFYDMIGVRSRAIVVSPISKGVLTWFQISH
jgi:hypothetical protein